MRPEALLKIAPEYTERIMAAHFLDDLLNVVVFGPGRGEAIVVRLPDGGVGVVDGCQEEADPVAALLHDLAELPLAPEERPTHEAPAEVSPLPLEFVCLTHPHEDHHLGQDRILEQFPQVQQLWLPPAGERHVTHYLEYLRQNDSRTTPAARHPAGLTNLITQWREHQQRRVRVQQLSAGMRLLWRQVAGAPLEIGCCGPAGIDVAEAQHEILGWLEQALNKERTAKSRIDPNVISAALTLRWGKAQVLLAGDLLCGGDGSSGWHAVEHYVEGAVQVVNAAHHASGPAHHAGLWQRMGAQLAIVTPFQYAIKGQPPKPEDIQRLAASAVVVVTSFPDWVGAAGAPRPRLRVPPPRPTVRGLPGARPQSGPEKGRNAVLVALNEQGEIRRLVLAGDADIYLNDGA